MGTRWHVWGSYSSGGYNPRYNPGYGGWYPGARVYYPNYGPRCSTYYPAYAYNDNDPYVTKEEIKVRDEENYAARHHGFFEQLFVDFPKAIGRALFGDGSPKYKDWKKDQENEWKEQQDAIQQQRDMQAKQAGEQAHIQDDFKFFEQRKLWFKKLNNEPVSFISPVDTTDAGISFAKTQSGLLEVTVTANGKDPTKITLPKEAIADVAEIIADIKTSDRFADKTIEDKQARYVAFVKGVVGAAEKYKVDKQDLDNFTDTLKAQQGIYEEELQQRNSQMRNDDGPSIPEDVRKQADNIRSINIGSVSPTQITLATDNSVAVSKA